MNVFEAIENRKSIRAFKPDEIPLADLHRLAEICQRAPSGTNTQPWKVWFCRGAVKEKISKTVIAKAMSGKAKSYTDFDYYPESWTDTHNARRRAVGWSLYGLLGITKDDRDGRMRQTLRNFQFFDAPVGAFITIEKYLTRGSWADVGLYAQTMMLAAQELGIDTCPQAAWIPFQEDIFEILEIPEDQELVTGMSLGYADPEKIENTLVSERERMEDVATFIGF